MSAALSSRGEVTVLRWPSVTHFEHLEYATPAGPNGRSMPRFGAKDNAGILLGLLLPGRVSWLRDAEWTITQRFAAESSERLLTTYRNDALFVTIEEETFVAAAEDALFRVLTITPDAGHPLANASLVLFENLAPNVEKTAFAPSDAFLSDDARDYAARCEQATGAIIHYSIPGRDPAHALDPDPGPGVYISLAANATPGGMQCGYDKYAPATAGAPLDAFDDAADGLLSGTSTATGHANAAIAWPIDQLPGGAITIFIAATETLPMARLKTFQLRSSPVDQLRDAVDLESDFFLTPAACVATPFAKRALLQLRQGIDKDTGAIVASLSQQPPYHLDWPRDGAFLNLLLDVAGHPEAVDRHNQLYAAWQIKDVSDPRAKSASGETPVGGFAMNFYSDGTPGGPHMFEIDEVGFALWTMYVHATFLDTNFFRQTYLESVYPAIARGADLLTNCVDGATKLPCAASEGDHAAPSMTLHGTSATLLGLASAVRAARYLGRHDDADRWHARLVELETAARSRLYDEAAKSWGGDAQAPLAWMLWPAEYSDSGSITRLAGMVRDFFATPGPGGADHPNATLSLAIAGGSELTTELRGWTNTFTQDVATPLGLLGEVYVYDGTSWEPRVAQPHLTTMSRVALTEIALTNKSCVAREHLAGLERPPDEGCGCTATTATTEKDGSIALLFAITLTALRSRARSTSRPNNRSR